MTSKEKLSYGFRSVYDNKHGWKWDFYAQNLTIPAADSILIFFCFPGDSNSCTRAKPLNRAPKARSWIRENVSGSWRKIKGRFRSSRTL